MDDADAGLSRCDRVRERDLASVDSNPAGVRLVGAAEDLDERRLSGAVFAAERVDLAPSSSAWTPGNDFVLLRISRASAALSTPILPTLLLCDPCSAARRSKAPRLLFGSRCILPSFMIIASRSGPIGAESPGPLTPDSSSDGGPTGEGSLLFCASSP